MRNLFLYYFKIVLFSFIITFPLIIPYFRSGYFPTDDGEWAVVRLSEMYREIKSFEIPPRYSTYLNFQYGYPLFNYTYPAPYYIGLVLVFLKLGFVNSIKVLFASSVVLSFFWMFIFSKSFWRSNFAGFVSAFLYVYVPYRLVDLYTRGSLGESLSFAIFPLILLAMKGIYDKGHLKDMVFFSLVFALLITMHNIMAVLFSLFILFILFVTFFQKNFSFVVKLIISIVYALCLSAFFWLPALAEKNLILLSKIPIADRNLYFVNILQLIIPKWGYGSPTALDGFSYQIGIPQILVIVISAIVSFFQIKRRDAKISMLLVIFTIAMVFLMFPISSFIWIHTPLLSEINYPWTLLALIMLSSSLLSGYLAKQKKYLIVTLFLCFLSFILVFPHAKPKFYVNRGEGFYTTNQGTTTSSAELMPLWVKKFPFQQPSQKIENLNGHESINIISQTSNKIIFNATLTDKRIIQVNTIYFPGWNAYVNGVSTKISYDNPQGVMRLNLEKGANTVKLLFIETPLRLVSDIVSLISLGVLFILVIFKFRKENVKK